MPVPKKKPKGALYQKYHNTITKLRRNDLWVNAKRTLTRVDSDENSAEQEYLQETDGKYFIGINLLNWFILNIKAKMNNI